MKLLKQPNTFTQGLISKIKYCVLIKTTLTKEQYSEYFETFEIIYKN